MSINRQVSIAPMLECTDRHDRFFLRLISANVLLYTEMLTTKALIHGDYERLLAFHSLEHPLALQLGGSIPEELATCAQLGEACGYDEINLNVGCPSPRVQSGQFGACLMLQPELVADCVSAMVEKVKIPVTIKCRIGVDDQDSYASLSIFIDKIAARGCDVFIIHARKAWLKGLSPKQNREIPPLRYDIVQQIKKDFPHLTIILNGGLKTLAEIDHQLPWVDGVMIGREAYTNPYFLAEIEKKYFSHLSLPREKIIENFIPYIELQLKNNIKLSSITRHILGLFHATPGARKWRRTLSEKKANSYENTDIIQEALNYVRCIDKDS